MNIKVKSTYTSWTDSLLFCKITDESKRVRMNEIWNRAKEAFARTTWPGWIDHSESHIMHVLRNLDMLIPYEVFNTITESEAFVLISSVILHDIGMIPEGNNDVSLQYYANLRSMHGEHGVKIIKEVFANHLTPFEEILYPVCEIVKNHHGSFSPCRNISLPYDLRANALWVRLADELDFGPHHAPSWLLDYIRPDEAALKHWKHHNSIHEPAIDLNLLRIQITGIVNDESFIRKIRAEFEDVKIQDLQSIFLNRGRDKPEPNRSFIIWDMTEKGTQLGESSRINTRALFFSYNEFFLGARYLYNLGRYASARSCFEDGINRISGGWTNIHASAYLYNYLKTLHSLGEHKLAIELVDSHRDVDFKNDIKAALAVCNGLGYWKLNEFTLAMQCVTTAETLYKILSESDKQHKVNEADASTLFAIVGLEKLRSSEPHDSGLLESIAKRSQNADLRFNEYLSLDCHGAETHYKGRYWGLMAFLLLFHLDNKESNKCPEAWAEAIQFAYKAFGGGESLNRNPFGAMCGKYCAAVVNYHKYKNCDARFHKEQALLESAKLIVGVLKTYYELFGQSEKIYRLWPKIYRLFKLIQEALPATIKIALSDKIEDDGPADEVEIYTPLH